MFLLRNVGIYEEHALLKSKIKRIVERLTVIGITYFIERIKAHRRDWKITPTVGSAFPAMVIHPSLALPLLCSSARVKCQNEYITERCQMTKGTTGDSKASVLLRGRETSFKGP